MDTNDFPKFFDDARANYEQDKVMALEYGEDFPEWEDVREMYESELRAAKARVIYPEESNEDS